MDEGQELSVKINKKMKELFEYFAHGKFPKDDTMTKRLGGIIKNMSKKNKIELGSVRLIELLTMLCNECQPSPAAIAFFLEASSYLQLSRMSEQYRETVGKLYEAATQPIIWNVAVVRSAWLNGWCNMLQQDVECYPQIQEKHLARVLEALEDESLFVAKEAISLTALFLSTSFALEHKTKLDMEHRERKIDVVLSNWSNCSAKILQIYLEVLEKVLKLEKSEEFCVEILHKQYKLIDQICSVLEQTNDDAIRNLALQILQYFKGMVTSGEKEKLEQLTKSLMKTDKIKTAIMLSHWLLITYNTEVDTSFLEDVLFLPINMLASDLLKGGIDDSGLHTSLREELLSNPKSFQVLLHTTLDLLKTYHKKKNLSCERLQQLNCIFQALMEDRLSSLKLNRTRACQNILDTFLCIFEAGTNVNDLENILEFSNLCVQFIKEPKAPMSSQHIQKVLLCLLKALQYLTSYDKCSNKKDWLLEQTADLWSKVDCAVTKLLLSMDWEITDSALEFLEQLLFTIEDFDLFSLSFVNPDNGGYSTTILQNMEHSQGYLRASALKCIGAMAKTDKIWQSFQLHSKDDILLKVTQVLEEDPEVFPRRAAMGTLTSFYERERYSQHKTDIYKTVCQAVSDADWEVKLGALNFWQTYLEKDLSFNGDSCKEDFLSSITETGCLACVLNALDDCDRSVREQACLFLKKFSNLTSLSSSVPVSKKSKSGHTTESEVLLDRLSALDLETLLMHCQLSDDQYDNNPLELIQDILFYVSNYEPSDVESDLEDNAIDCY